MSLIQSHLRTASSLFGLDAEDSSNVPVMTPLSATQYLRAYHPEPRKADEGQANEKQFIREQSVLAALRPFESLPMVTVNMLAEAWPGRYIPDEPNLSGSSFEPKESSTTSVHILPSLVDLTFVPALNHALQTGKIDGLDQLMWLWLPGNVTKIKENLRACNPLSTVGLAFLSKIIQIEAQKTKSIDLSHFFLTGEQVIELLSAQEGIQVLDLSHMQQITTNILRELIPILPNLRRLILLHTIADADILSLLSESPELFYRIESFIHFAFLRPLNQAAFPAVFSHIVIDGSSVAIASLPYFTLDQLVQGLTDYISLIRVGDRAYHDAFRALRYETPLLTAYASVVREPGRSWSERIVPFIPGHSFRREGWFLIWSLPDVCARSLWHYAFTKIDKEVMEECQRRIEELRSSPSHLDKPKNSEGQIAGELDAKLENGSEAKASLSDEEMRVKETAIRSEYADRLFHIFNVESFFQELVKEGRPAPSPEALTKLLGLCKIGENKYASKAAHYDSGSIKVFLRG